MSAERAPLVSVCIANYNGEAFVAECIESVLNQVDAPGFEIIVHDDASTDRSMEITKSYPGIRILQSAHNVGFCVSNNRMAAKARGTYLLLLNNDAVLFPDALRTLMNCAVEDDGLSILSLPQYDYDSGALLDRGFRIDPFANPIPVRSLDTTELAMVMGSCLWIKTALWRQIGGFPDWMSSIAEDLYLCSLARLRGLRVRVPPASGYRHHVGGSFGGGKIRHARLETTLRRRALSERNKTAVMLITFPAPLLMFVLPMHVLFLLVEGLVLATFRRDKRILHLIYLEAIFSTWRNRALLLKARRRAQSQRASSSRHFYSGIYWIPWKLALLIRHGLPRIK